MSFPIPVFAVRLVANIRRFACLVAIFGGLTRKRVDDEQARCRATQRAAACQLLGFAARGPRQGLLLRLAERQRVGGRRRPAV